jgi:hypothetical protein
MPIEKPIGTALLPDCRLKVETVTQRHRNLNWLPIFCGNCGTAGGWVPEETTFIFYLCQPCADKHGKIDRTYMVPDEVFFQEVKNAQLEKFGRELSTPELVEALRSESSVISTLARSKS